MSVNEEMKILVLKFYGCTIK